MVGYQLDIKNTGLRQELFNVIALYHELFGVHMRERKSDLKCDLWITDNLDFRGPKGRTLYLSHLIKSDGTLDNPGVLKCIHQILVNTRFEPREVIIGRSGAIKIQVEDIIYVETENRSIAIHTLFNEISSHETLAHWKEVLKLWPFLEVYRGVLVNMRYVESIVRDGMVLVDGTIIPIARRRYQAVLEYFREINDVDS
ncbi:LytTR family transcriptional regulator [Erysipelothrix sp. HDW6C]|uniref:LytR/AlgR family response regulator transcription factor n=1 Tax=Erysipelothrix sp. HDW6C TaxID=2714930 RepID=UPI00140BDE0A|nr:LytTR family DNA-binding domain-containing protein [Erysipelothrix sp. HDW6C]QIK70754.1 LytTR family transcriptional regulator [Erysipelothrix sp. HDW6C]